MSDPNVAPVALDDTNLILQGETSIAGNVEPPTEVLAVPLGRPSVPVGYTISAPIRVARIDVFDDSFGSNVVTLAGPDSGLFTLAEDGGQLFLNLLPDATAALAAPNTISVAINVDDPNVGGPVDAMTTFSVSSAAPGPDDYLPLLTPFPIWPTPVITYSFELFGLFPGGGHPFTDADKAVARDALAAWDAASGVVFVEVASGTGELRFQLAELGGAVAGQAEFPVDVSEFESIGIDLEARADFRVWAHEIGHGLGLQHPFAEQGHFGSVVAPAFNNTNFTVMANARGFTAPTTIGPLDRDAVHALYGNPDQGSYTFDPATLAFTYTGSIGDDEIFGSRRLVDFLDGGSGNDELHAAGGGRLTGGGGDDALLTIDDSFFTAVYSGTRDDYSFEFVSDPLSTTPDFIRVTDTRAGSPDGTDSIFAVDRVGFEFTGQPGTIAQTDIEFTVDGVNPVTGFSVSEGVPELTKIGHILRVDVDLPASFPERPLQLISLADKGGGPFELVGSDIVSTGSLDFEQIQFYDIVFRVVDGYGGVHDETIRVDVIDETDPIDEPPAVPPPIVGTEGSDTIVGTADDDVILQSLGGDTIDGREGNDTFNLAFNLSEYVLGRNADDSVSFSYDITFDQERFAATDTLRSVETFVFRNGTTRTFSDLFNRAPAAAADTFELTEDGEAANAPQLLPAVLQNLALRAVDGTPESLGHLHDLTLISVCPVWCPPCRGFSSDSPQLQSQLAALGVSVLEIIIDDNRPGDGTVATAQDAATWIQQTGSVFETWHVDGSVPVAATLADALGIMGFPHYVLYDPAANRVVSTFEGYTDVQDFVDGVADTLARDGSSVLPFVPLTGNVIYGAVETDSDPDGDFLQVSAVNGDASLVGTTFTLASGARLTVDATGQFKLDPHGAYDHLAPGAHTAESFDYTVSDGHGGSASTTVTFDITGANDFATFHGDRDGNVSEDVPSTGGVLLATDPDDRQNDSPPFQSETVTGSYGSLQIESNGAWTYSLDPGAVVAFQALTAFSTPLPDVLTVHASDGTAADIHISIFGADDPAVIGGISTGTVEKNGGLVATGALTISDPDAGQEHFVAGTYSNISPKDPGTGYGQLELAADGQWTYTLDPTLPQVQALLAGQHATDTFTVFAADGTAQTIDITIEAVAGAPVGQDDSYSTNEDTTLNVGPPGVLANDANVGGDPLTATLVSGPSHGALTFNANGSFNYAPDADFSGSDSFTYRANDGTADGSIATVSLTVDPVNDPPVNTVPGTLSAATGANLPVSGVSVFDRDSDPASDLIEVQFLVLAPSGAFSEDATITVRTDVPGGVTAAIPDGVTHGGILFNGSFWVRLFGTQDEINATLAAENGVVYRSGPGFSGTQTLIVRTDDHLHTGPQQGTVDATVLIAVGAPTVFIPTSNDDSYVVSEDTQLSVGRPGLLANDTDIGGPLPLVHQFTQPAHGVVVVNSDGSFVYTPDANYHGPDSFTYRAFAPPDGIDGNEATVHVNVLPVNDAPQAQNGSAGGNEDTLINGTLAATDVDGDALTYALVGQATHGAVAVNADGTFTYTPDRDFSGPDSFTYVANDGTADSNVATVDLTVNPVNDAPIVTSNGGAETARVSIVEHTSVVTTVIATDADGPLLTYSVSGGADAGKFRIDPVSGVLAFIDAPDFDAPTDADRDNSYVVTVTTSDSEFSDVQTITVTVTRAQPNLITGDDNANTLTGTPEVDTILGLGGNDTLDGREDDDLLDGGPGNDVMTGGAGNDTYIVDSTGDTIHEKSGEGTRDEVRTALASYTLAGNVENLSGTSLSGQILTGNSASNLIVGGTGNDTLNGAGGADVLEGGAGDDVLLGGNGNDTLNGGAGNDELNGGAGFDELFGELGSDILDGGTGPDHLRGGPGNTTYVVDHVGDVADEPYASFIGGIDTVQSSITYILVDSFRSIENLTLTGSADLEGMGNALDNVIIGNNGDNNLFGELGDDNIDGGNGNDRVLGGEGNDILIGGNGRDLLFGDEGNDTLSGGDDNDELDGGDGDDTLNGGAGRDVLVGGAGNDTLDSGSGGGDLVGGAGDDIFFVQDRNDVVHEEPDGGIDTVFVSSAFYSLSTRASVENLIGTAATGQRIEGNRFDNHITGGAGDDTLDSQGGKDTLAGGVGDDTYIVYGEGETIVELVGEGTDTVQTGIATFDLPQLAAVENLTGRASTGQILTGNSLANVITGGSGDDSINGAAGDDTLNGGAGDDALAGSIGDDTLIGGAGSDTLDGEEGNDVMAGGTGNDTYIVDGAGDMIVELTGQGAGIDTVMTLLATFSLESVANVENLLGVATTRQSLTGNAIANVIAAGSGDDTLKGAAGNDALNGNDGDDLLDGGVGDDTMAGGAGNDTYIVDSTGDTIHEKSGEGTRDEVRTALASYTLAGNVENLSGTSLSGQILTGNSASNLIVGGTGNDTLNGAGGADVLEGGEGDDTLDGGAANDTATYAHASDRVIVDLALTAVQNTSGAGSDRLLNIENVTGSAFSDSLSGSAAANVLTGLDGDDLLDGRNGADTLNGGAGDDILLGGSGKDTLDGGAGNDTLDGGAGDDQMNGGAGDDLYIVDSLGDIILEFDGGIDTVKTSLASYSLAQNVENLISTSSSVQTLIGNALDNHIVGSSSNVGDVIIGGDGNDTLDGGEGVAASDALEGDAGDDVLLGRDGNDILAGGAGNDTLDGGTGNDQMNGGAGDDLYIVDSLGDIILEFDGGIDTVKTSLASYSLAQNVENLISTSSSVQTLIGNALDNHIVGSSSNVGDVIIGGDGNDTLDGGEGVAASDALEGDAGDDVLLGRDGNDILAGGAGNDTLDGGTGNDQMNGGAGDDLYIVDSLGDIILEFDGGIDTVKTSLASYSLAQNVENLISTSSSVQTLIGNALDNHIVGSSSNVGDVIIGGDGNDTLDGGEGVAASDALEGDAGDDVLLGRDGNDILAGGAGNDTLDGGTGNDQMNGGAGDDLYIVDSLGDIILEFDGGIDTVKTSLASYSLAQNVENLISTSSSVQTLIGNALDNHIVGSSSNVGDVIIGGDGNDTLDGGEGVAASDALEGDAGDDVLLGRDGNDILAGGAGNDTLDGGTGNDQMNGGAGDDVLLGDTGDDMLTGGDGNDTFILSELSGVDTVTDFVSGFDHLQISAAEFGIGSGSPVQLILADAPGNASEGPDHYFILDNSGADAGTLYFDSNGFGGSDATAIAVLTGVTNLQATDFQVL